jgi:hypothetical protein
MRIHAEGVKDVKKMERKVKETSEREKVKKIFIKRIKRFSRKPALIRLESWN